MMWLIIDLLCVLFVIWFWRTLYRRDKQSGEYVKCKVELWVLVVLFAWALVPYFNIAMVILVTFVSIVKLDSEYDVTNSLFLKYENQIGSVYRIIDKILRTKF